MLEWVWRRPRDGQLGVEDAISRGWPFLPGVFIFPVRDKRPMSKGWAESAAADPDGRRELAHRFPDRTGWAVACRPSRLLIVDIDNKPGRDGHASWSAFLEPWPELSVQPGVMVSTASRGLHLWYDFPWGWDSEEGTRIGNSSDVVGPGIDIRSGRGASGGLAVFAAADRSARVLGPLTPPPAPLLERVARGPETAPSVASAGDVATRAKHRALSGLMRAAERLSTTEPGGRNGFLNWAAYKPGRDALSHGWPRATVEDVLLGAALEAGLSAAEASATIRSGLGT